MLTSSQRRRLDHALVDAFVAAAQQHHAGAGGQIAHRRLRQRSRRAASAPARRRSSATAANAASSTSGRITMPAPPPNGVSSTRAVAVGGVGADVVRVQATRRRAPAPGRPATARAARETSPETASARWRAMRSCGGLRLGVTSDLGRRHHRQPAGRRRPPSGTAARVNGHQQRADFQEHAGTVVVHRVHPPELPPVRRRPPAARPGRPGRTRPHPAAAAGRERRTAAC